MIFGRIFKKKQDVTASQTDTDASDDSVQESVLPQQYTGDTSPVLEHPSRRTKLDKKNIALGSRKRRRSNRVVHTQRAFHRTDRRSAEGRVNIYDVIKRPVITEKAANQSERGVYIFLVSDWANKYDIADAVEVLYGVRPKQIRVARRPSKKKRIRIPGKERGYGMTTQKKKAYVFLREGDTIKLT